MTIEWIINVVNFLIYILIFVRAIAAGYFNTFDLFATLIGVLAGVMFLTFKILRSKEQNE